MGRRFKWVQVPVRCFPGRCKGMTPALFTTYAAARLHMDGRKGSPQYRKAFPSVGTIADYTGHDERMVRRHLAALDRLGLIRRERRPGTSNQIAFPEIEQTPDTDDTPQPRTSVTGGADISDRGPRTSMTPTPDTGVRGSKEQKETTEEKPPNQSGGGAGFDLFWNAYPKHEREHEARQVWESLDPSLELVQTILQAVQKRKRTRTWMKEGGVKVTNPVEFIKGRRWDDEIPEGDRIEGLDELVPPEEVRRKCAECTVAHAAPRMLFCEPCMRLREERRSSSRQLVPQVMEILKTQHRQMPNDGGASEAERQARIVKINRQAKLLREEAALDVGDGTPDKYQSQEGVH